MSVHKLLVFSAGCLLAVGASAAPTLTVGKASSKRTGTTMSFPVTFDPGKASVAGIQFDLALPPMVSTVSVTAGGILTSSAKSVSTKLTGNVWTFIIFGLNQKTIGSGALLKAQVSAALGTAVGKLSVSNVIYTDPNGKSSR